VRYLKECCDCLNERDDEVLKVRLHGLLGCRIKSFIDRHGRLKYTFSKCSPFATLTPLKRGLA
jgi:hypothetical protein